MVASDIASVTPIRSWEAGVPRENGFREFLIGCGLDPQSTVRNYLLRYRQASAWCQANGTTLDTITATQIALMMRTIPRSQYTRIGQLRGSLKRYWVWVGRDKPPLDAIRLPPQPDYPNRALTDDNARLLAKAAAGDYPRGLAVSFGLFMALRATEIASVQWSRFGRDMMTYRVTGKGSRTHTLPVHPRLRTELARLEPEGDYLFPGRRGRLHVSGTTVWKWSDIVAESAGIGRLGGCHVLRHTCLTRLYQETGDLYLVQKFARHQDPKQTAHYVRQNFGAMSDAIEMFGYE